MKTFIEILTDHVKNMRQILKLTKSDIIKTYKGAALGWMWAIIKPAVMISVFYFAFAVGLRVGSPQNGYSYFLWFIAGMIPWFYMRDTIISGAGSIRKYKYLVTKIKYPVSTIPTFVSFSQFIVNVGLIAIMLGIFMIKGAFPDIYWLQIPFYMLLMLMFFTAWSLFAGLLSCISLDFLNLVKSLTTALFWMSGIIYNVADIHIEWIKNILLFNPITIIVNGFRNSLIYKQWFWEDPQQLINFAIVYLIMLVLGVWSYRKLRKDIPDVL